jgi:ABC-type transporter Mla subunit MlaD
MQSLTPEEKTRLAEAPRGTFALMTIVAVLLFAGWAFFYFGRFLGAGPVR